MFRLSSSSSSSSRLLLSKIKNIIISNSNKIQCNNNIIRNNYCAISSLSLNYNSNNVKQSLSSLSSSSSLLRSKRCFSVITEPLESLGYYTFILSSSYSYLLLLSYIYLILIFLSSLTIIILLLTIIFILSYTYTYIFSYSHIYFTFIIFPSLLLSILIII